jgi:hypothetical protein
MSDAEALFPIKLQPLFTPSRYKILSVAVAARSPGESPGPC